MKASFTKRKGLVAVILATLCFVLFVCLFSGRTPPSVASAASGDSIAIHRYDVDVTIKENREIVFKEKIDVEFLHSGLSMFYRSLPTEGDTYSDITASCEGNSAFSYYVADNPDLEGFFDINCVGGAARGNRWTYEIGYTMQIAKDDVKNGMRLDVIGFGWPVPLNDVTVTVHFPDEVTSYSLWIGGYGSAEAGEGSLSADKKTLVVQRDVLERQYNDTYYEYMAKGITLEFTLPKGALKSHTVTRIFTDKMPWVLLLSAVAVGLAVLVLFLTKKERDLVTVVNLKAPDEMDPLVMGKTLDGGVETEDVTSMIYYFAQKGYLDIDLTDENDPVLIKKRDLFNAPPHQQSLFNGLFKGGDRVPVSSLTNTYYASIDKAKMQVHSVCVKRIEEKSKLGVGLGVLLALAAATLIPLLVGVLRLGGGYTYYLGGVSFLPAALLCFLGIVRQNYRYKWKQGKQTGVFVAQVVIAVLWAAIYILALGRHFTTGAERTVIVFASIACTFICNKALSRTEEYNEKLGQILGFKDFILHTEEDRIKFMLKENPELFYHILPYAQVLGVTNEWTEKFEKITLEPPRWCVGYRTTYFDYMILHRSMRIATVAMVSRPQRSSTGRSGGGGSFGGFGGGGHGGGGGGAR